MALPPRFAAHALHLPSISKTANQPHTLEFFLDYTCPFSAKFFHNLITQTIPSYAPQPTPLTIIFRHQIQPWHPSSTLTHEAALAVEAVDGGKFWKFSRALFERQKEYYDEVLVDEGRNATYERLAKLAGEVGVDEGKVLELLKVGGTGDVQAAKNVGNGVTERLKWHIKLARKVAVHVSPTVYWDGIERTEVSSSWGPEQWKEFFEKELKE